MQSRSGERPRRESTSWNTKIVQGLKEHNLISLKETNNFDTLLKFMKQNKLLEKKEHQSSKLNQSEYVALAKFVGVSSKKYRPTSRSSTFQKVILEALKKPVVKPKKLSKTSKMSDIPKASKYPSDGKTKTPPSLDKGVEKFDLYMSTQYIMAQYGVLNNGIYFHYALPENSVPKDKMDILVARGINRSDVVIAFANTAMKNSCTAIGKARGEVLHDPVKDEDGGMESGCVKLYDALFRKVSSRKAPKKELWVQSCLARESCQHPSLPRGLRPFNKDFFPTEATPVPICCKRNRKAVLKLATVKLRLQDITNTMTLKEGKETLDRSGLPDDVKESLLAQLEESLKENDLRLNEVANTIVRTDNIPKGSKMTPAKKQNILFAYMRAMVQYMSNGVREAFNWMTSSPSEQEVKEVAQDGLIVKSIKMVWSGIKKIGTIFYYCSKKAFDLAAWIFRNPKFTSFLLSMANMIKQNLCRDFNFSCVKSDTCRSIFGYDKQLVGKVSAKQAAKKYANDAYDKLATTMPAIRSILYTGLHDFANSVGFVTLMDKMGVMFKGATGALFATMPFVGTVAGIMVDTMWTFTSSAVVMSVQRVTYGFMISNIGKDLIEIFTMDCLAQPPHAITIDYFDLTGDGIRFECRSDADCMGDDSKCGEDGYCTKAVPYMPPKPAGEGPSLKSGAKNAAAAPIYGTAKIVSGAAGVLKGAWDSLW